MFGQGGVHSREVCVDEEGRRGGEGKGMGSGEVEGGRRGVERRWEGGSGR